MRVLANGPARLLCGLDHGLLCRSDLARCLCLRVACVYVLLVLAAKIGLRETAKPLRLVILANTRFWSF